jgi:hypothetical protein
VKERVTNDDSAHVLLSIKKARRTRLPSSCRDCIIISISNLKHFNTTQQRTLIHPILNYKLYDKFRRSQCCSQARTIHRCRTSITPPTLLVGPHHFTSDPRMPVQTCSTSVCRHHLAKSSKCNHNARTSPTRRYRHATQPPRDGETCSSSACRTVERTRNGSLEVIRYAKPYIAIARRIC